MQTRLACGLVQVFCENKLVNIPMHGNRLSSDHFGTMHPKTHLRSLKAVDIQQ